MDDSSVTQPNVSSRGEMTTPTVVLFQAGGGATEGRKWPPPGPSDRNQSAFPPHVEEHEYHANAHAQAIAYIVIILVLYFSALTVIVVRYLRKERNQFHLPRYLLKKDRSPPSPSSFRLNSGRRGPLGQPPGPHAEHNNHEDLNNADTPPANHHAPPEKDHPSPLNKDHPSPPANQVQINTTAV